MVHTIKLDKRWHKLGLNKENFTEKWDPDWIEKIKSKINSKKVPSLIIFDDIIPIPGGRAQNEAFESLYTRGRHLGGEHGGAAIWASTQYYKAIQVMIRNNCSNLCLWLSSDQQARAMWEEHSQGLSRKDWLEIYRYCVKDPHSFLHINYANPDIQDRFCKKFEFVLHFSNEEDKNGPGESDEQEDNADDPSHDREGDEAGPSGDPRDAGPRKSGAELGGLTLQQIRERGLQR